jgi:bacteriocin-like protein
MKTLNYFKERKDKENKFEILDNEELSKIKGGTSDPPLL